MPFVSPIQPPGSEFSPGAEEDSWGCTVRVTVQPQYSQVMQCQLGTALLDHPRVVLRKCIGPSLRPSSSDLNRISDLNSSELACLTTDLGVWGSIPPASITFFLLKNHQISD